MSDRVGFTIRIDTRHAERVAESLRNMPHKIPNAVAGAINKTLGKVKTLIANGITEATTLKRGRVLKGTTLIPATPKHLSGQVRLKGRQVGAINFKTNKVRGKGYKFTFMKGDTPIHFRHAFAATLMNGNKQIAQRWKPGGGKPVNRHPILTIYGPSIFTIYHRNPQIEQDANAKGGQIFSQELDRQINRFLKVPASKT